MLSYMNLCSSRSQGNSLTGRHHAAPVHNKYDPGRATRANPYPLCTHFGKMCRSIYPLAFFCTNCEWWEREVDHCNKRVSRKSKTYSSKANHYSWLVPRPLWTVSSNRMMSKEEAECIIILEGKKNKDMEQKAVERIVSDDETICTVDEEDVEDNGSCCGGDDDMLGLQIRSTNAAEEDDIPDCLPRGAQFEDNDDDDIIIDAEVSPSHKRTRLTSDHCNELEVLKVKYKQLFRKSENFRTTAAHWKTRYNQTVQSQVPVTEASQDKTIDQLMNNIVHYKDIFISQNRKRFTSRNKFRRHLADTMWHDKRDFFISLREFFLENAITIIRKNVYSPSNVLRAMDMAGGQLSIEGIEVLRTCETNGAKYYHHSILPCSADIRRVGAEVEAFAGNIIPYKHGTLGTGGEFVEWVPQQMISMVIKGFGLEEEAKKRSISIHQAMDGAQLSKNITHVTYGFKMADRGALCPFSKKPLFGGNDNEASIQSRNNCFPLKIVMERESNDVVDLMRPIISIVKSMTNPGQKWMGDNEPINAPMNSDMSATWKIFQVGGAAKRDAQPCHCCAILSDDLSHANVEKCSRYCKNEDDVCFHQTFLLSVNVAELQTHYDLLQSTLDKQYQSYEWLRTLSQMELDEDPGAPTGEGRLNDRSIHFDFEAVNVTYARRAKYNRTINHELRIRHMAVSVAPLQERQSQLREACMKEQSIRKLRIALQHGKKIENLKAFLSLHDAVPCILHLENRVGLKFFTMLLRAGLSNAISGNTFPLITAQGLRFDAFFDSVNEIVNTIVIGTQFHPGQWDCPKDKAKKEVGIICLDNNRTRKIVNSFDHFVDLCIVDENEKTKWKTSIGHYRNAMKLLRKKTKLTVGELEAFQTQIDAFFIVGKFNWT